MHGHVFYVGIVHLFVVLGGQSSKALVREVNAQRVYTQNKDIQPEIEFHTVHKKGFVDILLDDAALIDHDVIQLTDQENAFTLG